VVHRCVRSRNLVREEALAHWGGGGAAAAAPPPPQWARASSRTRFLDLTQRCTTVGWTPLDEGSTCRRDLYLTTRNTHNRETSMPLVGFEPTISAGERPQTYALDRAATGIGTQLTHNQFFCLQYQPFRLMKIISLFRV